MQHYEIKGFTDQSERNKALVNKNKILEERVLRQIDKLKGIEGLDQRCIALAMTNVQDAFMWMNRGIFQPQRIKLPEDGPGDSDTSSMNEKLMRTTD